MKFQAIASLALIAGIALPLDAHAARVTREEIRAAADVCRPALPAYDAMTRVRPLGIFNESSTPAFVTCAATGQRDSGTTYIEVRFTDGSSAPKTCTLVSWATTNVGIRAIGYQAGNSATPHDHIRWTHAIHNGGAQYASTAISCKLDPGEGILQLRHMFQEEIGQ